MEYKAQKLFKSPTETLVPLDNGHKSEYRKVYHLLDELGFSNLKSQFSEHQIRDSTLAYMESEEELKVLLKEVGLPAGPVFAFVKLWFRYKDNPDNFELDMNFVSHNDMNDCTAALQAADDKNTQTDIVNTTEVGTQTHILGVSPYQAHLPRSTDPYEMFNPYAYLPPRMPLPGNLPHGAATYGPSLWPYTLPNIYQDPSSYNSVAPSDLSEFSGLMNGLADKNSFDPLENFSPHDADEPVGMPLEKNGSDVAIENEGAANLSNEYALFPNTEPLCSPKTSHMNLVNEKDDVMISQLLQAEQERDQRSYATALKDHKEGQQSLPNSLHNDHLSSPSGARSRSSSTASTNNLSRSASSSDFHPLSPTRETHEMSTKSPPNRPYLGVDDIDPQQKANLTKSNNVSSLANPSFSDYYENLQDTPEYLEATRERNVKAGWRPHGGKHEKSCRRMDFKPQYIDKEGRVRHGVRVRGALKSMECWLHTNSKPPIDCLFAHSRIGDTLEFICIRCTYEKARNYECRDKKGHGAFVCNLGPYRDINGEKWRGKVEPS